MLDVAEPTLFAESELPRQPLHDPEAVREKLQGFLDRMRAAASWPWKAATVAHYRETVWPSLLAKLLDPDEAAHLRAEMDAEAARLDALP